MAKQSVMVKCEVCGREVEKKTTMQTGETFICKNDDGLCVKPSLTDKAKALVSKVKAEKAEKAAKKVKIPKPKVNVYYSVPADYKPNPGEKLPPRQAQVILDTIQRHAVDGKILKSTLVEILEANNGKAEAIAETFTHDLQAKQPALAILMHYQKRLVDEGRLVMTKA